MPSNLTCWLLPSRNLLIHNKKLLFALSSASFHRRIPWSIKSKAFRKSKNSACIPDLPSFELSVALYQFWGTNYTADTVDFPLVKGRWVLLSKISDLFRSNWFFSCSLAIWGRMATCRKSFWISLGQLTLGIGVIRACLYANGNLHSLVLQQIMSFTAEANQSSKRLSSHAGVPLAPVAFLGLRCLSEDSNWPIDSVGGALCHWNEIT